jgi:hypothetical protein
MSERADLRISLPLGEVDADLALAHAMGAALRKAVFEKSEDPYARYGTPKFTEELLEHLHRAKKAALKDVKD